MLDHIQLKHSYASECTKHHASGQRVHVSGALARNVLDRAWNKEQYG
jgi:hypothetical protein